MVYRKRVMNICIVFFNTHKWNQSPTAWLNVKIQPLFFQTALEMILFILEE